LAALPFFVASAGRTMPSGFAGGALVLAFVLAAGAGVGAGGTAAGCGSGAGAGACSDGWLTPSPIERRSNSPGIEKMKAVRKKTIAAVMVIFASTVCVPRGP